MKGQLKLSEQQHVQLSEQNSILKSQCEALKDRYLSDCEIFQMRLDGQSKKLAEQAEEFSRLKMAYENDMDEVKNLTDIFQNSIASLQKSLNQKEERVQLLLRSELLEMLCLAVSGSRIASRSDVVTAFWNEKPETRVQLLDWFSELQTHDIRQTRTLEQHLSTPNFTHRR